MKYRCAVAHILNPEPALNMGVTVGTGGRSMHFSRRHFVQLAGASALIPSRFLKAQTGYVPETFGNQVSSEPSKVALVSGDNRRKNVYQALVSIDDQLQPILKRKKRVVIKPNCVSDSFQL